MQLFFKVQKKDLRKKETINTQGEENYDEGQSSFPRPAPTKSRTTTNC